MNGFATTSSRQSKPTHHLNTLLVDPLLETQKKGKEDRGKEKEARERNKEQPYTICRFKIPVLKFVE